jgi:photosystem II stability/assembly factor-like uncharacterized protein
MKRTLFIFALVMNFLTVHAASSDSVVWVQQQSGVQVTLWQVKFADTLHGWACGDAGTLLRTADGGSHWQKAAAFTSRSVNSICFTSRAVGWAVTDTAQIYKSTDSGATWTLQFSTPRADFGDCLFFDDSTGFAAGSDMNGANMYNEGILYKTVNGGTSWTLAKSYLITIWSISSLAFPDRRHGWALGDYDLLKTTDGGLSWQTPVAFSAITDSEYVKTSGYINRICFEDTLNGFGIGRNGHIIRTRDGGASWTVVTSTAPWPEGISFADREHGVVVGERGAVLTSSDSGSFWNLRYPRQLPFGDAPWFRDVVFLDVNNGWLVGDSGIVMKGRFFMPSTAVSPSEHSGATHDLLRISAGTRQAITVVFTLREPGAVSLELHDLRGRKVMTLAEGGRNAGVFSETYAIGRSVPCGTYCVTLRGNSLSACAKTVLFR